MPRLTALPVLILAVFAVNAGEDLVWQPSSPPPGLLSSGSSLGSGLGGTNPEKDGCRFCTSPISKCAPGRRGYLCLMVATGSAPGHRACDRPGNGTQGHLTPKGEHADNCLPSSGSRQSTKLRLKRPGSPSCSNALLRDLEQGLNFWVKWEKQCLSVY